MGLRHRCWKCHSDTLSVAGVLVSPELTVDGEGFIDFSSCSDELVPRLSAADLTRVGVGELRKRWSNFAGRAYTSNGCVVCGALQGNFPLGEAVFEHRMKTGSFATLTPLAEVQMSLEYVRLVGGTLCDEDEANHTEGVF